MDTLDAPLPIHMGNIMFINPSQSPRKHVRLILSQVESFHQLANRHVFLRTQPRWLLLEVIHDQFQRSSCFVLGRRARRADGRDSRGVGVGRRVDRLGFNLGVTAVALDRVGNVCGRVVHFEGRLENRQGQGVLNSSL